MAIYSGFTHRKWWFSIVMLNYQRVLNYGKSRFLMGKSTINAHFQWLCKRLPEAQSPGFLCDSPRLWSTHWEAPVVLQDTSWSRPPIKIAWNYGKMTGWWFLCSTPSPQKGCQVEQSSQTGSNFGLNVQFWIIIPMAIPKLWVNLNHHSKSAITLW